MKMKIRNILLILLCIIVVFVIAWFKTKKVEGFQSEQKRVVIVGCARNVGSFLDKTLDKLMQIKNLFHTDSRIVVAENDSTDNTKEILRKHADNVTLLNYDGKVGSPLRTERLAYLRNELMDYAHKNYPNYDYVINADLDSVTHSLNPSDVTRTLEKWEGKPWDALFANSQPYYDIWALRSKDIGCTVDCWDAVHHDTARDVDKHVSQFRKTISRDSEPMLVDSAFGGFGIYRLSSTKDCKYDGKTRVCSLGYSDVSKCNQELCEHVPFHEDMKRKGHGNLYIDPDLMVTSQ